MFDPYHKWLAIPKDQRPPSYYQLLGISPEETDPEVIEEAAIRQTTHVRAYQAGPYARQATRLLNEIAQARGVLLIAERRKDYDSLRRHLAGETNLAGPRAPFQLPSSPRLAVLDQSGFLTDVELVPLPDEPLLMPAGHRRPANRGIAGWLFGMVMVAALALAAWKAGAVHPLVMGLHSGDRPQPAPEEPIRTPAERASGDMACWDGALAGVHCLTLSPDGRFFFTGEGGPHPPRAQQPGFRDCTLRMWDMRQGRVVRNFSGHSAPIRAVSLSSDGRLVATAGGGWQFRGRLRLPADCTVRIWDIESGDEIQCLEGHTAPVQGVAFLPDGQRLITCGQDLSLRLWDRVTGREIRRLDHPRETFLCLAVSPDGRRVLTGSEVGLVQLWDPRTWKEVRRFARADGEVRSVVFCPDGLTALSGGGRPEGAGGSAEPGEGLLRLWELDSGKELRRFDGHSGPVCAVDVSPDGRWVASGGADHTVRLWDLRTGKQRHCLGGHWGTVSSVAFLPEGPSLLSAGLDRTVRRWNFAASGEFTSR